MRRMVLWLVWWAVALTSVGTTASAAILINEVLADPAGDANGDGSVHSSKDEFVELVNTGVIPVSLASWTLADLVQVRHVFADDAAIPPAGFFVVFGGAPQGFAQAAAASTGTLSLNNTGDTVTLRDAGGALIDTFSYGAEGNKDTSLTRSPDATGPFVLHNTVSTTAYSPGRTVNGATTLPLPEGGPGIPESPTPTDGQNPIVPEPSPLALLGIGALGLPMLRRTRVGRYA